MNRSSGSPRASLYCKLNDGRKSQFLPVGSVSRVKTEKPFNNQKTAAVATLTGINPSIKPRKAGGIIIDRNPYNLSGGGFSKFVVRRVTTQYTIATTTVAVPIWANNNKKRLRLKANLMMSS
mmetsp:Transcript_23709/g.50035  ORF Transcript_23709/g.50035 Transcript_23709/m.50035 type:complete len:122 (+) Transcript_23709:1017-1382(+)